MSGDKERGRAGLRPGDAGGDMVGSVEPTAYLMGCLHHPKAQVSKRPKKSEFK